MSTLVLVVMSSIANHGKSSRREKISDKELCQYGSAKPLDILGSFIAVGISLVKAEFIVIQDKEQALLRLLKIATELGMQIFWGKPKHL